MIMRPRDPNRELSICREALKMIFSEGLDGFSMQKLARAAQVSPATLYIYFKDRDDLILELYAREMHRMTEAALEGFDPEMHFAEGLRVQWKNRARYYLKHPQSAHFLEQIRHTPFHRRARKRAGSPFLDAMHRFVDNAVQRGEIVSLPLEIYWSVAYAPLYQLLKFHIHGSFPGQGKFVFDEQALDAALALVVRALRP